MSAALVLGGVDFTGPHLHTVRFPASDSLDVTIWFYFGLHNLMPENFT